MTFVDEGVFVGVSGIQVVNIMRIVETIWNAPFVNGLLKNTWEGHYRQVFVVHGNKPYNHLDFAGNIGNSEISSPDSSFSVQVRKADVWIIHRYVPSFRHLIYERRKQCLILIQTWGPDYLSFFNADFDLYQPKTFEILKSLSAVRLQSHLKDSFSRFKRIRKVVLDYKFVLANRRAFGWVDGVMFCIPNESLFIRAKNIRDLSPVRYNQYDNKIYRRTAEKGINFKWVQLGNSADPSNNHVDALFWLSQKDLQIERLLIPLSYGGTQEYVNHVKNVANQLFPDKCIFLDLMMEQEDFLKLTDKYGVFVSNVTRQQSLGNLFAAVNRGALLMLNSHSIAYNFFLGLNLRMEVLNGDVASSVGSRVFDTVRLNENSTILQRYLASMTAEMAQNEITEMFSRKFAG